MAMLREGMFLNGIPVILPRGISIVRTMASLFPMSRDNAPTSTAITSPWFVVGGAEAGSLTIVGGYYQLKGSSVWSDDPITVSEGTILRVQVTSSSLYYTLFSLVLTCNSLDHEFDVTTVSGLPAKMTVGGKYVTVGGQYVTVGG